MASECVGKAKRKSICAQAREVEELERGRLVRHDALIGRRPRNGRPRQSDRDIPSFDDRPGPDQRPWALQHHRP
jgi:hypothetical protein